MRAVPTLICWIGLLAACASAIQPITPGGPSFQSDDFRFVAPTGWQVRPSMDPRSAARGRLVVYVASQPLRDDCTRVGAELVCRSPLLEELSPGGMLVAWTAAACVAQGCDLPEERLIAIGNRQGVRVPLESGCEGSGFTERSAYHVTVTPQRVDTLFVCARDPSDATRAAFLGFLAAIRWRIP